MYRLIFVLLSISVQSVHAQKFLIHEYEKSLPDYVSQLKIVDFDGGHEIASYGPIKSRSREPLVLDFPELSEYLLVTTQKKKNVQIHVVDKETLKFKHMIETERMTEEYSRSGPSKFLRLINGGKELAMVVGKARKKALVIFDTNQYKEIARFPINSKYSVAKLSKNGRFVYFKSNLENKAKQSVVVIDVVNKKKLPLIPQEKGTSIVADYKDFLLISSQRVMSRKDSTKYSELKIYDLNKPDEQFGKTLLSNRIQRFVELSEGEVLLIANRTHKSPHHIQLYELTEGGLKKSHDLDIDVKLNSLNYHSASDLLLLSGKENMAVLDLSDMTIKNAGKLTFNAEQGLLNSQADKAFFVTNSGSSMVGMDLLNNRMMGDMGIGSANKKIGKAIAQTVFMAASYYFGGVVVIPRSLKGGTGMVFNADENKLFVHSAKTQDVTVFDAIGFTDKYTISDIKSLIILYKDPNNLNPIVASTDMTTTLVDQHKGTVFKEIEHDHFMGLNTEHNFLVLQQNNKAILYSSATGEKLGSTQSTHGREAFYLSE